MLLLTGLLLLLPDSSQALEQPEYDVLVQDRNIEIRHYQAFVVAETAVAGARSYASASNEGFMRLFRYISGDNEVDTEIDMTAPVLRQASASRESVEIAMTAPVQSAPLEEGWNIAFMLPSKYSLTDAPSPLDERISLRIVPARTVAVIRYSGRWTERNLEKFTSRLREYVDTAGLLVVGEPEAAVYNPPYVPPFMRRNEIMIEVAGLPPETSSPGAE